MTLSFERVTFTHEGAVEPLLADVSAHFPAGWTGVVGANGAGKTTVLHLAAGALRPQAGTVRRPGPAVYCPQRTDDAPDGLPRFAAAGDAAACALRGRLAVGDDWASRWATLSHGERKRAQIGVALWQQPELLLVDEPTNHIDANARALLLDALGAFRGTGLLVSHDRELLDQLCGQCLFLDPPRAVLRPGNYTQASEDARREERSVRSQRQLTRQELARLTSESQRRRAAAGRADRLRSARHLARGDSDGRGRIGAAIVSGKDGQAGRLARQMEARLARVRARLASFRVKKEYATTFWLEGSTSPRPRLFALPAGEIDLDGTRRLAWPDLVMNRRDRIALTGANGLGKSTLIRHLLPRLDLPAQHLVYLPQEIDLARTRDIMRQVQQLPGDQLGQVMTVVSALGSRPERLLRNLDASPGELRKVLLALGVARRPHLIVMDEPTNHLDLPAIESLEAVLRDCPCGLLLASHDARFLAATTRAQWDLRQEGAVVRLRTEGAGDAPFPRGPEL